MRSRTLSFVAVAVFGVLSSCGGSNTATPTTAPRSGASSAETSQAPAPGATTAAPSAGATATTAQSAPGTSGGASDEKCSTDGSPTKLDPLAGEVVPVPVAAASAQNNLPDLTLRRINCNPGFANLKNELPAAKPVLFWFWAPF